MHLNVGICCQTLSLQLGGGWVVHNEQLFSITGRLLFRLAPLISAWGDWAQELPHLLDLFLLHWKHKINTVLWPEHADNVPYVSLLFIQNDVPNERIRETSLRFSDIISKHLPADIICRDVPEWRGRAVGKWHRRADPSADGTVIVVPWALALPSLLKPGFGDSVAWFWMPTTFTFVLVWYIGK